MAGMAKLRSARGALVVMAAFIMCGATAYTPEDNYLLSCGSSVDTPVGGMLFLADGSNPARSP
jgi:hypothetical protein